MKGFFARLATGVLLLKLAVLLVNFRTFPRLRGAQSGPAKTRVSVLVPARDEADNLRHTLPALLAQGAYEVIVLDDDSRDATARVAQTCGARVLMGQPLPAGWAGKNWACQQLAQAATGDVLIFTDADVQWHGGALASVLTEFERSGADLLSVWPRQQNLTPGERLVTPLLDDLLLCWFPAPLVALPHPDASAANGQVMVFRREAYGRLGGHAAVQGEVLEDIALGRAVKASGGRLRVALGGDLISVRMYRSYPESLGGIAKLTLPFHRHSRAALLLTWGLHLLVYSLPWLRRQPLPIALSLLGGLLVRQLAGRRSTADRAEVLLTPVLPLLATPIYWLAWQKQVRWKDREYTQAHSQRNQDPH